jgi:hypothetical protein
VTVDVFQLGIANLCFWAAGWGVHRLVIGPGLAGRLGGAATAYLVGVATVGVLATLLLLAGASLDVWEVVVLCVLLCALGLLRDRHVRPSLSRIAPWWAIVLLATFLVVLGVDLLFQPLWAYDAWAQWTPKAKSFVLFDGLDVRYFQTTAPNSDYPILVPALEAIDFRFMGGFATQVLHVQFFLLVVAYAGSLFELLLPRSRAVFVWALVATIVVAPSLGIQAAYALADVPLAVFFSIAGVFAWIWLEEDDPRALALMAVFGAAALAAKNEGALFVGTLFAVMLVLTVFAKSWRKALITLAAGVVALVAVVPWRLWAHAHHLTNYYAGSAFSIDHIDRVPVAAARLVRESLDPTSWLALLPLALAAAVLAWIYGGARRGPLLVFAMLTLPFVELVLVYWATSLPFDYDLNTTARRVIMSPLLFAAVLSPLLLEQAVTGARRARVSHPSSG